MCGRYTLTSPPEAVEEFFEAGPAPQLLARYNLAPSQESVIVTADGVARMMRRASWGLPLTGGGKSRLAINARSESAHQRGAFKESLAERRCLVPANGFFEWKQIGRTKQPYYFTARSSPLVGFGGLWSRDRHGAVVFVILTTAANEVVGRVHHRMPVIVATEQFTPWLEPRPLEEALRQRMLGPWPEGDTLSHPVGLRVNDAGCDEPGCISPLSGPVDLFPD